MSLPKWLAILEAIGPTILSLTPLAPLVPSVIAGIKLAEAIPGATGEQKKALVQQIVAAGVVGANAQAGHEVLNPEATAATASAAIDTVVGVVNAVHAAGDGSTAG